VKSEAARRYESPLREEQTAATRSRILDATAALLGDEHPATLSIPAVAARAGVAVRTVYRHFPTKEALLDALYEYSFEQLGSPMAVGDVSALIEAMPAAFGAVGANRDFYRAMNSSGMGREVRERTAAKRRASVESTLREATKGMRRADARRLGALAHVLTWSNTALLMQDYWDLSAEDAAQACGWALELLINAAGETKEVGR
jgi:AcrR family transcriptional regulator